MSLQWHLLRKRLSQRPREPLYASSLINLILNLKLSPFLFPAKNKNIGLINKARKINLYL